MRYVFISLIVGLVLFIFAAFPVSAHLPGQPPYFTINGKYSDLYPIESMFPDIQLPQDIAPEQYLVGRPIRFEIDTEELKQVVPEEIIKITTFTWKFGDGAEATGLKNTHIFEKMGTYVLEIYAGYEENGQKIPPTLIQLTLLHVLPDKSYQLPRPVIKVNGKEENKDPSKNVFELNFKDEVMFDATSSHTPSTIVSYLWSFTDGTISKNPVAKHKFSEKADFVNPALRITDSNGFYVDAYVGIKNNPNKVNVEAPTKTDKKQTIIYTLALLGALFVAGFLIWLFRPKKN